MQFRELCCFALNYSHYELFLTHTHTHTGLSIPLGLGIYFGLATDGANKKRKGK